MRVVVAENLCLSSIFSVSQSAAFTEKVEASDVVSENLSLSNSFLVAKFAAFSEKVEATVNVTKNLYLLGHVSSNKTRCF